MNRPNVARWALLFLACAALLIPGNASAQSPKPDLAALIDDIQKIDPRTDQMSLVFWMPEQYWRIFLTEDGSGLTAEGAEEVLKTLRPYLLYAVTKGKVGPMGGVTYESEPGLRRSFSLIDQDGKVYHPLSESEINADVKNFLAMLKPAMAGMLGPMGENLHFYAFPTKNAAGKLIADPTAEGKLTARLGDVSYEWRLPLGSLVAKKMCPQDKEVLSGAWSYCPWHGTKLVPAGQP